MTGRALAVAIISAALCSACGSATVTPDQVVAAFIAASQDDARTMHMEWQGSLHESQSAGAGTPVTESTSNINSAFDFSGSDYAGDIRLSGDPVGQTTTSYARVSGVLFARYEDANWQQGDNGTGVPPEIDPLYGLSAADVQYEAPDTLNGRAVHRLRVLDPAAALQRSIFGSRFANLTLSQGGRSDYFVYVDANGVPVSAQLALDLSMTLTDPNSTSPDALYQIQFDYEFSLWGEPVTISPPDVSNNGGIDDFPPPNVPPPTAQPSF